MMKNRELSPRSNQHTSLKLTINTINNNTSGFIHPGTRARQSRALFLLGSLLSLDHRSKLPLSTLEHPARRPRIHASSADRQTVTFARTRRTAVVAASIEDANRLHFVEAITITAVLAELGTLVDGIADVDSIDIGTAGAQTVATLTWAGVCWDLVVC
jgi:hypothetical protein